jgi:hypothetical protein
LPLQGANVGGSCWFNFAVCRNPDFVNNPAFVESAHTPNKAATSQGWRRACVRMHSVRRALVGDFNESQRLHHPDA